MQLAANIAGAVNATSALGLVSIVTLTVTPGFQARMRIQLAGSTVFDSGWCTSSVDFTPLISIDLSVADLGVDLDGAPVWP